jgi:hypothetical protein
VGLPTNSLWALEFIGSQHGWAAGNGFFHTTDGGKHWTQDTGGDGFVARTIDGGQSWHAESVQHPAFTAFEGLYFLDADHGWISGPGIWRRGGTGPAPSTYCVAKTSSIGCSPAMAWSGTPSASAASGFLVTGSNVQNRKPGLLLHGITGRLALPFQGGTLCVNTPLRRTPVVQSGGSPPPAKDCSGLFAIDMNAFAHSAGTPAPMPELTVPGTVVDCQWWGRDPGFPAPNNTTLSNGLEYTVEP